MKIPKSLRASYTIEASLLFPFILTVIVLIVYGSFFIHDRAVLNAAACQAAVRGCCLTSPRADVMETVRQCGESALSGRLLSTGNLNTEIQITKSRITVRYTGDFVLPSGAVLIPGMWENPIKIQAESHSLRLDPTGFVRECRIVENAGDRP